MDRLAVNVSFFFLLFSSTTFAIALGIIDNTDEIIDKIDTTAIDTKENDAIGRDLPRNFPDPETKSNRAIFLPSNKPESEPEPITFVDWKPVNKFAVYDDAAAVVKSTEPETFINTIPINRRFGFHSPGRTMRPLGPGHRCRHHHHQMLKPLGPGFRGREVSYGDDMLISGDIKGVGPDPTFKGGVRQIPSKWVWENPEGTRFPNLRKPMPMRPRDDMLISGGIKGVGPDPMFRGGVRQIPARWVRENPGGTRFPSLRKPMPMRPREDEEEIWTTAEFEPMEISTEEEKNYEKEHHHDHHHHEKGSFLGSVRKFLNQF